MIVTNETYNSILQGEYSVLHRFIINNDTAHPYGEDSIVEGKIQELLFEKYSIGNLFAKTLDVTFIAGIDIPRKAKIKVQFAIRGNGVTSSWYPRGTYYVSKRTKQVDGSTTVKAYDATLKTNTVFMPSGTFVPISAHDVYVEICNKLGISVHPATKTYLQNNAFTINVVPSIGTAGTTMKEMLRNIGVMYGKNWIINESEQLAMIFSNNTPVAYDAADIYVSPSVEVDRLRIFQSATMYYLYPAIDESEWLDMSGFIIEGDSSYITADNISRISSIVGTSYTGFEAADVVEDPAVQLGDKVIIEGHELVLVKRLITFGDDFAQWEAPYEEETEEEYPQIPAVSRQIAQSEERTYARIQVTDDAITQEVADRQEAITDAINTAQDYADDINVTSVKTLWYRSTSNSTQTGGSWVETMPDIPTSGTYYLWTKDRVTYKNGTTADSTPRLYTLYKTVTDQKTEIASNAEQIALRATKDELSTAIGGANAYTDNKIGANLSPFFGHPFDDVQNSSTNPEGYWHSITTSAYTKLTDGWAQVNLSNPSSASSNKFAIGYVAKNENFTADSYTMLVEIKELTKTGDVRAWTTSSTSAGQQYRGGDILSLSNGVFRITVNKATEYSEASRLVEFGITVEPNSSISAKIRVSIYKSGYLGDYIPYAETANDLNVYIEKKTSAAITIESDNIKSEVSKQITYSQDIGKNLSPFFNHPFTDESYSASTDNTYWNITASQVPYFDQKDDGWVRFHRDNTSGTGLAYIVFYPQDDTAFSATNYTLLIEVKSRNQDAIDGGLYWSFPATNTSSHTLRYYVASTDDYTNASGTIVGRDLRYGSTYVKLTRTSNDSANITELLCGFIAIPAGYNPSFWVRFSLYKDGYWSSYIPYIPSYKIVETHSSQILQTDESISLEVSNRKTAVGNEESARKDLAQTVSNNKATTDKAISDLSTDINNQLNGANGIKTRITATENSLETVTGQVDDANEFIEGTKKYMNWNGTTGVLSVGNQSASTHSEMRNDGFAVVDGGRDIFRATGDEVYCPDGVLRVGSGEGAYAKVGRFKWEDEGSNGFSLIYTG